MSESSPQAPRRTWSPTRRRAGAAVAVLLLAGSGLAAGLWLRARQAAPSAAPASPPLFVDFVSRDVGWVSVDAGGATTVLRTTDGGRQWQKSLSLPSTASVQARFFDGHQGFLLVSTPASRGQQLYETGDGGVHWSPLTLPSPPTAYSGGGPLSFADPMHGWYLLPAFNSQTSQDFTLYSTVDGGRTWSPLLTADIAHPMTRGLSNAGVKTGLSFRDAQNGWMGQVSDGAAVVWITHDGGLDWQQAALPAPPEGWAPSARVDTGAAMSFSRSPDAVEATAVSTAGSARVNSLLFVTPDGGTSWTARSLPLAPAGQPSRAGQPGPGLHPPPAFTGGGLWWYPQGSTLYESSDGGQQWRQAASLSGGRQFAQVEALDAWDAWAVVGRPGPCAPARNCLDAWTDRSLLRTVDGGRHWTAVSVGEAQQ